ncbi:MAG: tRNA pseudouridine(38-40) synthase TruA [Fidelibacterota bacterium]
MPNYKIILEYDGAGFSGWQLQRGQRTVQGVLEEVLRKLNSGRPVRVHGAGRTDAGVHARGQVASFILEKAWPAARLLQAINGNLDEDLHLHSCEIVPAEFHARFSARSRTYRYRCRLTESVIDRRTVWYVPPPLNLYRLRRCALRVLGEHDFTSFCKASPRRGNRAARTLQGRGDRRCTVLQSQWIKRGDFVTFVITANRFLHHMICYLVGTMVEVGRGRLTEADFGAILDARNREAKVFKAPSRGLFLEEVTY